MYSDIRKVFDYNNIRSMMLGFVCCYLFWRSLLTTPLQYSLLLCLGRRRRHHPGGIANRERQESRDKRVNHGHLQSLLPTLPQQQINQTVRNESGNGGGLRGFPGGSRMFRNLNLFGRVWNHDDGGRPTTVRAFTFNFFTFLTTHY